MIIDAQVHAYAADSPEFPWADDRVRPEPPQITGREMVAAMDGVGVDAAILVSPWAAYRADTRYVESVYREFPDRFRLVAPIDPEAPDVDRRIAEWIATPGAVGFRLLFTRATTFGADHPGVRATMRGATAAGTPINVHCWSRLDILDALARSFSDTQLVLDHLGMRQPDAPPAPAAPFANLDQVLALARYPNVAIKLTGACTYSHRPFPYEDLREPIGRVIEAFGVDRCLWGTDWQRTTRIVSYEQATRAFRDHWPVSDQERAALMGGTARRIYDW